MKFSGLIEDDTSNIPLTFVAIRGLCRGLCLFVCLFVSRVTQKVMNGFQLNFQERLRMVRVTSH